MPDGTAAHGQNATIASNPIIGRRKRQSSQRVVLVRNKTRKKKRPLLNKGHFGGKELFARNYLSDGKFSKKKSPQRCDECVEGILDGPTMFSESLVGKQFNTAFHDNRIITVQSWFNPSTITDEVEIAKRAFFRFS